jgi:hypothetical protein
MFSAPGHKRNANQTTLRFHLTPVRIAIIMNTNNKCLWRFGGKGTLIHFWWQSKLVQPLWKTVWKLLKKLKIELLYDPVIPLLGVYQKECESCFTKTTCIPMYIFLLFTIAKLWKQPRCPANDECIKKMWYLYSIELYSATKKNEILSFTCKGVELENIILSVVSQTQKAKK